MPPASLAAPRLDKFLPAAAILTNRERVAALWAALALHGVPMTRHHSEPNTPDEVAELEARLAQVVRAARVDVAAC